MFQLRAGVARWRNFVQPRAIITRAVDGRASRDCAFSVVCLFCRLMCLNRSICIFHPVCCWKQCLHFVKKSHTAAMIRPHGDDLSKLAKICPPILFFHRLGKKNEQKRMPSLCPIGPIVRNHHARCQWARFARLRVLCYVSILSSNLSK